jgi:hypothetical protein
MTELPDKKDFVASNGKPLRELYAIAVLRALTPMERAAVLHVFREPK